HCYSYEPEMAKLYLDLGYYIGVGGVLTFKNGRKLKETVAITPIERIMLETDCPYLAPVPHRGERNDSTYINYVVDVLAEIKAMSREDVIRITTANSRAFYGV
ncbi:MAG: TatD family hydrolase, partial [Parasporobacterium sp.]|nr:TatD family hydrolase [Parasporobacterium sp.]